MWAALLVAGESKYKQKGVICLLGTLGSYYILDKCSTIVMAQAGGGKRSLLGKWKLIRNGSDYLPGLDNLSEGPLVLKLNGQSDIEFFKIEQKRYQDNVEEIQLAYVTKNYSDNHSFQLAVLNYENVHGNDILLGIIKNVNDDFSEFTVCRLGPKAGQNR